MSIERGLSIRQPFAWAICANVKRYENRTWTTDYRGTIAIHASVSPQNVNELLSCDEDKRITKDYFQFGAIIGLADIIDIQSYGPQHEDNPFATGPYCWEMANGRLLDKPIPMKGKLNLFHVPKDIKAQIDQATLTQLDLNTDSIASYLAQLMNGEPDPLLNYQELVNEYAHTGNHFDAIKVAATRMVELDPNNAYAYNLRGYLHWTPETADQSTADYQTAIDLDPMLELAWYNLANNLVFLKDFDQLENFADKYVHSFPDSSSAYEQRSRAFYWQKQYQQALLDADKALKLNPESAIAWALRAEINRELGHHDAARADIQHAITLAPEFEQLKDIEKTIPGKS